MVSWGRAFRGALAYVIYSIVWFIIGGAVIIGGVLAGTRTIGPYGIPQVDPMVLIVVLIIGYAITALGSVAALFKVMAEITAEEVEKRVKPTREA